VETIGFIGLGRMGAAMARNLLAAGFRVRAWNRTPGKTPQGAIECASPREAAGQSELVITMVADDAAAEQVTLGENGVIAGLPKGGMHAAMSTISVALSRKLQEAHRAAGQRYVSAPVFGRPEAAEKKQLWIVYGGAPADLETCRPAFAAMSQGVYPVGAPPQAHLAKLIGNFLILGLLEAVGEATALAEKGGLDPRELMTIFGKNSFGSPVFNGYAPRIAATEFEPAGFALPLGLKDATLALQAGAELRVPLPLASLTRDHLLAALARGRESWDWSGLASVVREAAGLPPRRA